MTTDLNSIARRRQKLFDRRTILFLIVAIAMFGALVAVIIVQSSPSKKNGGSLTWTPEEQFKYANVLESKGLKKEALVAYEDYMNMIASSSKDRAKVAYQMGNIYMDLGEYEKALASFYRIDMEDPNTELAPEVAQKVVAALERLGMTSQARYELESRTAIGKKEEKVEAEPEKHGAGFPNPAQPAGK